MRSKAPPLVYTTMASSGAIVYDTGAATDALVRLGAKRQIYQFFDVSKPTRTNLILPLGSDTTRMFILTVTTNVTVRARVQGSGSAYTEITSTAPGLSFRGRSYQTNFYVVYTTANIQVQTSSSTRIQAYQVSLILPIPRVLPSQSGYLGERLGDISTGDPGTPIEVRVDYRTTRFALGAPGDLLVVTGISINLGTFRATQDGTTYSGVTPGYIFDIGTQVTFSSTFYHIFTVYIYRPIRKIGSLAGPPNSRIKTFVHGGDSYRPGDSYPSNEGLATNIAIQGTNYLVSPPAPTI